MFQWGCELGFSLIVSRPTALTVFSKKSFGKDSFDTYSSTDKQHKQKDVPKKKTQNGWINWTRYVLSMREQMESFAKSRGVDVEDEGKDA